MSKWFIFIFLLSIGDTSSNEDFGYTVLQTGGIGDALKFDYPNFGPGLQQFS